MWQRFSEAARKVIFYAQDEAQRFGEGYVSTEHILLGLLREPDCTGVRIIKLLNTSVRRVREALERELPREENRPSQDMTLTPRAKRVIDLAYDQARNLGHDYIGTEHLLLGLIAEGDGLAGKVLHRFGLTLDKARDAFLQMPQPPGRQPAGSHAPTEMRREGLSATRLSAVYSKLLRDLVERAAAEGEPAPLAAAAALAQSGATGLAPAFLVLMALSKPSGQLSAALDAIGENAESLATALTAAIAAFGGADLESPPFIDEVLSRASTAASELGQNSPGDLHLILACLELRAPLVTPLLESLGITHLRFRQALS